MPLFCVFISVCYINCQCYISSLVERNDVMILYLSHFKIWNMTLCQKFTDVCMCYIVWFLSLDAIYNFFMSSHCWSCGLLLRVTWKLTVLWVVAPYSMVEADLCFWGACCLHHHPDGRQLRRRYSLYSTLWETEISPRATSFSWTEMWLVQSVIVIHGLVQIIYVVIICVIYGPMFSLF